MNKKIDPLKLPRQEDVTEVSFGKLVKVTEENRPAIRETALSMYVGAKCIYCEHVFISVEDIIERDLTKAGEDVYACRSCWKTENPEL